MIHSKRRDRVLKHPAATYHRTATGGQSDDRFYKYHRCIWCVRLGVFNAQEGRIMTMLEIDAKRAKPVKYSKTPQERAAIMSLADKRRIRLSPLRDECKKIGPGAAIVGYLATRKAKGMKIVIPPETLEWLATLRTASASARLVADACDKAIAEIIHCDCDALVSIAKE
jgi:hypothetical protein